MTDAKETLTSLALASAALVGRAEGPATSSASLEWINDYVGVPYLENGRDRRGWDCWGLVLAVYREQLGRALPDFQWPAPHGVSSKLRAFAGAVADAMGEGQALELAAPEPWAIALIRYAARPHHVGVLDGAGLGVLHAQRYGGTLWVPLARFVASYGEVSWFRWRP